MKIFSVRVTQDLHGYYEGYLKILAKNKKEAQRILNSMNNQEIDNNTDWEHGDDYWGDINTIKIEEELEEI